MTMWGIHRLSDIIARPGNQTGLSNGTWVRSILMPYDGNKIKAAWCVLTGKAYALQWPEPGDLEKIL